MAEAVERREERLRALAGSMRYSTVTSTGPRSSSIVAAHDRRRPVHRRRQIDIGAGLQLPAPGERDGAQRAGGRDEMRDRQAVQLAIWPHTALPSVMRAEKTVTNSASPRPRTHSGSATCADTFRVDEHRDPRRAGEQARRQRSQRRAREPEQQQRDRRADGASRDQPIGAELPFAHGSANAPPTAPAPIAPSSRP